MKLDEIYNNMLDKSGRVEMLYQMLIVACADAGFEMPVTPARVSLKKQLALAISNESHLLNFVNVIKAVRRVAKEFEDAGFVANTGLRDAKEFVELLFPKGIVVGMNTFEVELWLETHSEALRIILP